MAPNRRGQTGGTCLQHVADDFEVLDDVVRSVDEEARGHAVEGARVLRCRVYLRHAHVPGDGST